MNFYMQERHRSLNTILRGSVSRLTLSASLGLLGLAALPTAGLAACPAVAPFVCDAANTVMQTILADNAAVTTLPGFSVNVAPGGGGALTISGDGALSYIDANNSVLTGSDGLYMRATGDGGGNPGSITVETGGQITGGGYGIGAVNDGSGSIDITASGLVGSSFFGINAINGATAGNLTIDAATVGGDYLGIYVINNGRGFTNIAATGLVQGGLAGIVALNGTTATALIIDAAATAAAGLDGDDDFDAAIYAINKGIGFTSITATGTADGALSAAGILAFNEATASSLSVIATSVTGGVYGIQAVNSGTSFTNITATGNVVGAFTGINVINGEIAAGDILQPFAEITGPGGTGLSVDAATVSGGFFGIDVTNNGSGFTDITASGLIEGGANGISAINLATAGDLTIRTAAVNVTGTTGGLGFAGIGAENEGDGNTSIFANGAVTATTASAGIFARNHASAGAIMIEATSVAGAFYGIFATNNGDGATDITARGLVEGGLFGIGAFNDTTATDLTINAASVGLTDIGGGNIAAVLAQNHGNGATSITTTGAVDGALGAAGIAGFNSLTATSLTIDATSATGSVHGIVAVNNGLELTSATRVTASGDVVGGFSGITAVNGEVSMGSSDILEPFFDVEGPGGTDLSIDAATVGGGFVGIFTQNYGTGSTGITATGLVQGGIAGIVALNETTATDLTINAAATAVLGDADNGGAGAAIYAMNEGKGATSITATGTADGALSFAGILALNEATASSLTVTATSVTGGLYGILAANGGTGATSVTATGNVQGGLLIGIAAINGQVNLGAAFVGEPYPTGPAGTNLTVSAAGALGGEYGIYAVNLGNGFTRVTSGGNAVGTEGTGIDVFGGSTTAGMTISANNATGERYGLNARHFGSAPLNVTTTGLIQGGVAAISATSAGQPIDIVNDGTLQNLLSSSLAVEATGGPVTFANNGSLFGTVLFGADGNSLTNAGIWNSAGGTSDFGGGANSLVNQAGAVIFAAVDGSVIETTTFNNATSLNNRGTFTMMDGGAGDRATLGGSASFEAGSVYAVDIGTGAQSDLLTVEGIATLMAGSTLTVDIANGPSYGARYTVLTANGGLDGQFGSFAGATTAFLSIDDFYDANNVYLDVTQYRSFTEAALTPNQLATAGGLQSLPTDTALFAAVADLPTDAQAQAAFDSLSGEIGASAKGVLLNDSQFLRGAVFDRLTSAGSLMSAGGIAVAPLGYAAPARSQKAGDVPYPVKAEPVVAAPESAIWAQGFGSWGNSDGNGNAASLDRDTGGFFMGADTLVANSWRLGILGGYSSTSFDVDERTSSGESDNYHLGIYAGTSWGAVNFRAGAAYSWNDISTSRSVYLPTAQLLQADYDAGTAQLFGELGYGLTLSAVDFEPFVGLAYVNLSTDGTTETGGIAALSSASDSTDATYTSLGLRAAVGFQLGKVEATARGMLGWRHAFGDITPTSAYQFASGSSPFTVSGVPIAEDAALIEAGLDLHIMPMATFGVAYGGQFGDGATDQSFTANLNVKF